MPAANLLTLIDDIAIILDDMNILSKIATKNSWRIRRRLNFKCRTSFRGKSRT